jgi:predicted ArsR family transcriptional regulator
MSRRRQPPSNGTCESREAARAVEPHTPAMRHAIVALLAEEPGLTCKDIEKRLEFLHETTSARLKELSDAGRVRYDKRRGARGRLLRHYYLDEAPANDQCRLPGVG